MTTAMTTAMTTVAVGTVAAGSLFVAVPSAQAATPSQTLAHDLAELRGCESSGDYAIDTGNGFYGAYQFDLGTWESLGLSGLPNDAPPAVQDQAAATLENERGWEPWPACSARLGLVPIYGVSLTPASAAKPVVVARPTVAAKRLFEVADVRRPERLPSETSPSAGHHVLSAPRFDGTVLSSSLVDQWRPDVLRWQARMAQRGWVISVDGYFGPQSARVATLFAQAFHLSPAVAGQVDKTVWDAAWTQPVTR